MEKVKPFSEGYGGFYVGNGLVISHNHYENCSSFSGFFSIPEKEDMTSILIKANNNAIAFNYVENLEIDGYSDWDIPSLSELKYIDSNILLIPNDYVLTMNNYWSKDVYKDKWTWVLSVRENSLVMPLLRNHQHWIRPVRRISL